MQSTFWGKKHVKHVIHCLLAHHILYTKSTPMSDELKWLLKEGVGIVSGDVRYMIYWIELLIL